MPPTEDIKNVVLHSFPTNIVINWYNDTRVPIAISMINGPKMKLYDLCENFMPKDLAEKYAYKIVWTIDAVVRPYRVIEGNDE